MVLPPGLARFNRVVTNRVTRPFAGRLPWFGVLHHVGRRSGKEYQTPLNAWNDGDSVIVALTYGENVDWLANVRQSGSATIVMMGRSLSLGAPRTIRFEEGAERMPSAVAALLPRIGVDRFVVFPVVTTS